MEPYSEKLQIPYQDVKLSPEDVIGLARQIESGYCETAGDAEMIAEAVKAHFVGKKFSTHDYREWDAFRNVVYALTVLTDASAVSMAKAEAFIQNNLPYCEVPCGIAIGLAPTPCPGTHKRARGESPRKLAKRLAEELGF